MKQFKYTTTWVLGALLMLCSVTSFAQQNNQDKKDAKKISLKQMIDSQHFIFNAESVNPMRGGFRMLTSTYDVSISKDTLVSDLPYFGRAYIAAYNPTKSELDFTTTGLTYTVKPYKKTGWFVVVKPTSKTSIQQYAFTIFEDGTASLTVTSTSRDPISFNGHIITPQKLQRK